MPFSRCSEQVVRQLGLGNAHPFKPDLAECRDLLKRTALELPQLGPGWIWGFLGCDAMAPTVSHSIGSRLQCPSQIEHGQELRLKPRVHMRLGFVDTEYGIVVFISSDNEIQH